MIKFKIWQAKSEKAWKGQDESCANCCGGTWDLSKRIGGPSGMYWFERLSGSDSKDCLIRNSWNPLTGSRVLRLQDVTCIRNCLPHNNNNNNYNNNNNNNNTVWVFSSDIGMDLGIEKCATMVMKRGKLDKSQGIRLPDGRIIRSIGDDAEGYKYLGVLEANDIMHDEVKRSMKKEYIRRVKKTLFSKLNAGYVIKAINSWAVSLLWYSGGIVNWTKSELELFIPGPT